MGRHTSGSVLDPPPPPPPPAERSLGDRIRFFLRGAGQTLITLGLIVFLFVFYEVYVTTWFTDREQTKLKNEIAHKFADGDNPLLQLPNGSLPNLKTGEGIANIYIPRFGRDYAWTIVQGTNQTDLAKGPGHYVGTALPGQIGNFAIAGHRVGKGEPFLNQDKLKPGDSVIIETEAAWYVYKIKGQDHDSITSLDSDGIPGREIIAPNDGRVLDPVPDHPGMVPTERLLTMTTCHPKFTATHRMVDYGVLDPSETVLRTNIKDLTMPAPIAALYNGVS
jgi:sortase A